MSGVNVPIKDLKTIKKLIPHREPMIFIESIEHFSEHEITSTFKITTDDIFVEHGSFLEMGLIENMAQTAASLEGVNTYGSTEFAPIGYLLSINELTISQLPKVDETIMTKAIRRHTFNGLSKFGIEIFSDGNLIASAEITTAIKT